MNTQSIQWSAPRARLAGGLLAQARGLHEVATWAVKVGFAILPALGIMIVATWAVSSPVTAMYLQALLWAGAFVFVALAVEAEDGAGAGIDLAVGLSMLVLSGLSVSHAPDLAVVASALPAARIAMTFLRR